MAPMIPDCGVMTTPRRTTPVKSLSAKVKRSPRPASLACLTPPISASSESSGVTLSTGFNFSFYKSPKSPVKLYHKGPEPYMTPPTGKRRKDGINKGVGHKIKKPKLKAKEKLKKRTDVKTGVKRLKEGNFSPCVPANRSPVKTPSSGEKKKRRLLSSPGVSLLGSEDDWEVGFMPEPKSGNKFFTSRSRAAATVQINKNVKLSALYGDLTLQHRDNSFLKKNVGRTVEEELTKFISNTSYPPCLDESSSLPSVQAIDPRPVPTRVSGTPSPDKPRRVLERPQGTSNEKVSSSESVIDNVDNSVDEKVKKDDSMFNQSADEDSDTEGLEVNGTESSEEDIDDSSSIEESCASPADSAKKTKNSGRRILLSLGPGITLSPSRKSLRQLGRNHPSLRKSPKKNDFPGFISPFHVKYRKSLSPRKSPTKTAWWRFSSPKKSPTKGLWRSSPKRFSSRSMLNCCSPKKTPTKGDWTISECSTEESEVTVSSPPDLSTKLNANSPGRPLSTKQSTSRQSGSFVQKASKKTSEPMSTKKPSPRAIDFSKFISGFDNENDSDQSIPDSPGNSPTKDVGKLSVNDTPLKSIRLQTKSVTPLSPRNSPRKSVEPVSPNRSPSKEVEKLKYFSIFDPTRRRADDASPTKRTDKKMSTRNMNRKSDNTQMIIDAGQKEFGARQCDVCGTMYEIGNAADESSHMEFHNRVLSSLKFIGWKNERVVRDTDGIGGRVVMVTSADPPHYWRKVKDILDIVDEELGFSENGVQVKGNTKVFLYILNRRIVGCLVAEGIQNAYRVIPQKSSTEGSGRLLCCSNHSVKVWAGISRLWVLLSERRKGIAALLVNTMRCNMFMNYFLSADDFAFSDPTENGVRFAEMYTSRPDFLVYRR